MAKKERHTLTIEKVVTGGQGLARLANGMVVMVPFVLPGETVAFSIQKQHQGFAEAALLEVLVPSPQRVCPPCPYYYSCGGCHLQHGDYPAQLAIKEGILLDQLTRQRRWSADQIASCFEAMVASPRPFHYRQRIRLQVDTLGRLGYFAPRSHAVVEIDTCPLAKEELNLVLAALRGLSTFRALASQAVEVELKLNPRAGRVVVIVHLRRQPRAADRKAAQTVAASLGLVQSVWLAGEGFTMDGPYCAGEDEGQGVAQISLALSAGLGGRQLLLTLEAGGFCQVHLEQNEALVHQLLTWSQVTEEMRVLDLFCGMGNFSLPLALTARQVVGTDLQRAAIRCAQANAKSNHLDNCRFVRADALRAIQELRQQGERFALVLLDPPRSGCREIISQLSDLGAEKLLYISCDPATLVRDLGQMQGEGFVLRKIRGVDMFPQTSHLETIALLTRV